MAEDRQRRAACWPALPRGCGAQTLPRGRALSSPGSFDVRFGGILFWKQVVGDGRPGLSWLPSCSCCRQTCWPGISGGWSCLGCAAQSHPAGRGRGARRRSRGLLQGNRCHRLWGSNPSLLRRAMLACLGLLSRRHCRPPQDRSRPQALWATAPWRSLTRLSPAQALWGHWHQGTSCLLQQAAGQWPSWHATCCPSSHRTLPSALHLPPDQHHARTTGSKGPGSSAGAAAQQGGGKRKGRVRAGECVSVRAGVCVCTN